MSKSQSLPTHTGQKHIYSPSDMEMIRATLREQESFRDWALFSTAIDTMLRSCDLLELKVQDVTNHYGEIVESFTCRQKKTAQSVTCALTRHAREALYYWIEQSDKMPWQYLFTPLSTGADRPITTGQYRRLVKKWAEAASLDTRHYSGHSTRRTKAAIMYRETGDLELVRLLLGHRSLNATSHYLNVSAEEAVRKALEIEV